MQNSSNTAWDMGLADMIEETPEPSGQPTRFYKDRYLIRQEPSWEAHRPQMKAKKGARSVKLVLVSIL